MKHSIDFFLFRGAQKEANIIKHKNTLGFMFIDHNKVLATDMAPNSPIVGWKKEYSPPPPT
jgi:hypothetical protein